jgi:hypothetical protein
MSRQRKDTIITKAAHLQTEDGELHAVAIFDLPVLISRSGGYWFAQGLAIDYAAQGVTIDESKKRFEEGLCATVHHHLRMYGDIEKLLVPAPKAAWDRLWDASKKKLLKRHSQTSFHELMPIQLSLPDMDISYAVIESLENELVAA